MSWITNVNAGVWEVEKRNDYAEDPDVIINKFEELFLNELVREFNDTRQLMSGLYNQIGTITVFINPEKNHFKVIDNYNNLLAYRNGIYNTFNRKMLCINTKLHGLKSSYDCERHYFEFREKEDDEWVSLFSIVNGYSIGNFPNVRRMINVLFSRQYQYLESTNPETFMFMDYSEEEKQQMIEDCERYDKIINKKKSKKDVGPLEEE